MYDSSSLQSLQKFISLDPKEITDAAIFIIQMEIGSHTELRTVVPSLGINKPIQLLHQTKLNTASFQPWIYLV